MIAALFLLATVSATAETSAFGGRAGPTFNLTQFGAVGDNATLNTAAFEEGVAAVEKAGGGTLVVPAGIFITAPFNFTSHMTLFLDGNAVVRGPTPAQLGQSPFFPLWPIIEPMPSYGQGRDHGGPRRTSLLHGENLTDIAVTASEGAWGTIDGFAEPWWTAHKDKTETVTRGHLIEFIHCEGIEISNLYLRNSPFWTVHPVYSKNIVIRNIDVWAPKDSPNTDGVDPESSSDVLIENFSYHGGDDVIAIKSGWDCYGYKYNMPCKNIFIRNVTAIWTRAAG
jgi:polygalacturonase